MLKGKAMNAAKWFADHQEHGFKEQPMKGPPGLINYVCMKCKRGLITTERPGYTPISGAGIFGRLIGNGGGPNGAG